MQVVQWVAVVAVLAYAGYFILKKSESPVKLIIKTVVTIPFVFYIFHIAIGMGPNGLFLVMVGSLIVGIVWTPDLSEIVSRPFTGMFDGGGDHAEKQPFYFIANAKRKRGLYAEAVTETQRQLRQFPNDFDGVMLLAAIQAENLHDLAAAENTLNQFCEQPKVPENRVASAWTLMADWHLQFGADKNSALASLQKIIARYPGSQLALGAEQRIAHIDGAEDVLVGKHDRQKIIVPVGVKNLGLRDKTDFLAPPEIDPTQQATVYIEHLEAHPHDSEIREKLAVSYARDFRRLDLAGEQLMQLIDEPRHSNKQIAGWLNLLANFQIELGADIATVRATLEQVGERFSGLPVADIAQRRLAQINLEFKAKETATTVKLGTYEQNIGLKYGAPRPKNA